MVSLLDCEVDPAVSVGGAQTGWVYSCRVFEDSGHREGETGRGERKGEGWRWD